MKTLCAEHLFFRYDEQTVLRDISVSLQPGQLTMMLGPNGAGKSTLLKLLAGLLTPEKGKILLNGENLSSLSRQAIAKEIGVFLQQSPVVFPMTAEEYVLLGRTAKLPRLAPPSAEDFQATSRALQAVGLSQLAGRSIQNCSGGELQRLRLAATLALESDILLLDEPFSAQDPAQTWQLLQLLKKAAKDKIILIICHSLTVAAYADRLLLLGKQSLLSDGIPRELLTPQQLQQLYRGEVPPGFFPATEI